MDHLRWGGVALVVTVHAAVTYSGIGGWYYHEPATLDTTSLVVFLAYELHLQAFFMGLLFLVAGYFVPGGYDRKGPRRFWRDRLMRLGAPTAFYALVIEPVIFYTVLFHKGEPAPPFWQAYPNYLVTLQVLGEPGRCGSRWRCCCSRRSTPASGAGGVTPSGSRPWTGFRATRTWWASS